MTKDELKDELKDRISMALKEMAEKYVDTLLNKDDAEFDKFLDENLGDLKLTKKQAGALLGIIKGIGISSFLAGLKAGRPKWHDLRKDPNDLPLRRCIDNNSNVVRLFHNSWDKKLTWYRYDFHECEWQMETEPIAWCEIPKYTGE